MALYKSVYRNTITICRCVQDVECIVFDGQYIVSSCLAGELRVWDSNSGDCLTAINRSM